MTKSTKRNAIVSAVLAIIMCMSLMVGGTYAWFTDTASTKVNRIQAGTLDLGVEYTLDGETWADLEEATELFGSEDSLFEPGYTRVVAFKISNKGNLAFKYKMSMNIATEKKGVNKAGDEFALSDYLKVRTSPVQAANYIGDIMLSLAFDRSSSKSIGWNEHDFKDLIIDTAANGNEFVITAGGEAHYFIMQVYMPESVGNEANAVSTDKTPYIEFGVDFFATQAAIEKDSFDNKYDENAQYPLVVDRNTVANDNWYDAEAEEAVIDTAEDFLAFMETAYTWELGAKKADVPDFAGKTIKLDHDVILPDGYIWTPISSYDSVWQGNGGFKGTFDGQGHTIKNMHITSTGNKTGKGYRLGLFGEVGDGATFKNLVIDGADILGGNSSAGAVVAFAKGNVTFENITVKNSIIRQGRYVGGILGDLNDENGSATFKNCTVKDCALLVLHSENSAGALVGSKYSTSVVSTENCTCENVVTHWFNGSWGSYTYEAAMKEFADELAPETSSRSRY